MMIFPTVFCQNSTLATLWSDYIAPHLWLAKLSIMYCVVWQKVNDSRTCNYIDCKQLFMYMSRAQSRNLQQSNCFKLQLLGFICCVDKIAVIEEVCDVIRDGAGTPGNGQNGLREGSCSLSSACISQIHLPSLFLNLSGGLSLLMGHSLTRRDNPCRPFMRKTKQCMKAPYSAVYVTSY